MIERGSMVVTVKDGVSLPLFVSVRWRDGKLRRYRFASWGKLLRSYLPVADFKLRVRVARGWETVMRGVPRLRYQWRVNVIVRFDDSVDVRFYVRRWHSASAQASFQAWSMDGVSAERFPDWASFLASDFATSMLGSGVRWFVRGHSRLLGGPDGFSRRGFDRW